MRLCKYCDRPAKKFYDNRGRFKQYSIVCEEHFNWHRKAGPSHPNATKNGRRYNKDGYVQVLDPRKRGNLSGSRYTLEHRLVMEQKLGRELKRNEIVHHLNGVRDDNRPENLIVIEGPKGHTTHTFPKLLQQRIRELEAQLCCYQEMNSAI